MNLAEEMQVPGGESLLGFMGAALVVLLIPGLGVMYVVARSVNQGTRAGLLSVLGLATGALLHVVAATLGLSAILLASPAAFGIVKILGAGYLVFLGVRTMWARPKALNAHNGAPLSPLRLYTGGVVVSAFNPKIAIFFLAFLPQFVEPGRGPIPRQVLMLGFIYIAMALVTDGAYALLAGSIGSRFSRQLARGPALQYLSGGVYLALGLCTALISR
jgi:threonine/homoserine/homoserine lactone efflux protein